MRVLARNPEHPALEGLPVEVAPGDLRDPDSLETALTGCARLFHVAADYRLWVPNPEEMYAVNVEGTRNLLAAARAQGLSGWCTPAPWAPWATPATAPRARRLPR